MSHCFGVACGTCHSVLVPDDCPERDCRGHHGYTLQDANPYAARTWPGHDCFRTVGTA